MIDAHNLKTAGRALWAVVWSAVAATSYLLLAVLPIHAFYEAAPGEMREAVSNFGIAIWSSLANSGALTIGVLLVAVAGVGKDVYTRFVTWDRHSKAVDWLREYIPIYDSTMNTAIIPVIAGQEFLEANQYNEVKAKANTLLVETCNKISETFEAITGGKCCVTLKTFEPGHGIVETKARDNRQPPNRKKIDARLKAFPYGENSAFKSIVDDNAPSYISNWLAGLWLIRYYANQNKGWIKAYTATAVVPIAVADEDGNQIIRGFLCVDNFIGRFPKKWSASLLEIYASRAHTLLDILGKIRQEDAGA